MCSKLKTCTSISCLILGLYLYPKGRSCIWPIWQYNYLLKALHFRAEFFNNRVKICMFYVSTLFMEQKVLCQTNAGPIFSFEEKCCYAFIYMYIKCISTR